MVNFLKNTGWKNVSVKPYNTKAIDDFITKRGGQPVIIRGDRTTGNGLDGHYWLIDGTGYRSTSNTGPLQNPVLLFHCNFGWGGSLDGWYDTGIFICGSSAWFPESGSPYGDKALSGRNYGYSYTLNLQYFNYDTIL